MPRRQRCHHARCAGQRRHARRGSRDPVGNRRRPSRDLCGQRGPVPRDGQECVPCRWSRARIGDEAVNNMLGQIATVAIAEALVFGKKAGLDPHKIYEVVRVSTGSSVQFENRVPRMLARNFVPGGTIDISYKDQELETSFAKQLGVPLLLANVTQQVYQMARAAGLNKEDGSSITKVFERMAGVTIGGGD